MKRSKRVIFVSHCILNQNTVVCPLARANGAYTEIVEEILKHSVGIHQLPCPEYRHLGLKRKPMTKEEYNTEGFRNLSRDIALDTINIIKEYIENEYEIVGLIGINHSPTCSINGTQGILMEELLGLLDKQGINIHLLDVPGEYEDGKDNSDFIHKLKEFLT